MSLTRSLARWSTGGTASKLAENASQRAGVALIDWFGAYYAGLASQEAAAYRNTVALSDPNPGMFQRAWLIAAVSHIREVDDGHRLAMLHPGVVVFPPILALAGQQETTAGRMRWAITAGYEIAVRIGAALGKEHYRRHHSSGTAGCFGAAAAAGIMLGLSEDEMVWALGHAGTQAAGLWQILDDGAEIAKPAHIGHAVRNGIWGAVMAKAGIAGASHILEGRRGFAEAFQLKLESENLVPATEFSDLALMTSTIKAWPVCGQMHHILDGIQSLRDRHPASVDEIASIRIVSFAATREIAGVTDPQTLAQARFSTAFCVACLWIRGTLEIDQSDLADPTIRQLAQKISLHVDPKLTADFPQRRAGEITLVTRSGAEHRHFQEGRRGDPEHPLPAEDIAARFERFAMGQPLAQRDGVRALAAALGSGHRDTPISPETIDALLVA